MARCYDCHWFESAPPAARNPEPCADLGELPQNQACDHFKSRVEEIDTYEVLEPTPIHTLKERVKYLGSLTEESYRSIFHEILAENFVLAQDADLAVKTVQAQLQAQGATAIAPAEDFKRTFDKLVDLYVTYRMINAVGLSTFANEIMSVEIANKFKSHLPPSPKGR